MAAPVDFALPALIAFTGGLGAGYFLFRFRRPTETRPDDTAASGKSEGESEPRHGFIALAETLREIVLVLDERDRLAYYNKAAKSLLPSPDDSALGRDAAVVIRSADFLELLKGIRTGSGIPEGNDILIRRAPVAADITLEADFAPLPDTGRFGPGALAVVMTDVSRLRKLENVRREFVANVSHDLRTPVTIVKGAAHMLVEDYDGMADEDRLRFLEKIQRNTRRLHVLLEDLLELTSLEETGGGALHLRRGVLHHEIHDTCRAMEDRLTEAKLAPGFRLEADDTRVAIDAPKFARVIQNLIENALRYANGATRLTFSTDVDGDKFILRIEDNGPGIAQAEYAKVFERFYRAEKSRSTAGGGSGLGLSIVKHIVLAHAGTVHAEPAKGRGFAVVVTLPLAGA